MDRGMIQCPLVMPIKLCNTTLMFLWNLYDSKICVRHILQLHISLSDNILYCVGDEAQHKYKDSNIYIYTYVFA